MFHNGKSEVNSCDSEALLASQSGKTNGDAHIAVRFLHCDEWCFVLVVQLAVKLAVQPTSALLAVRLAVQLTSAQLR